MTSQHDDLLMQNCFFEIVEAKEFPLRVLVFYQPGKIACRKHKIRVIIGCSTFATKMSNGDGMLSFCRFYSFPKSIFSNTVPSLFHKLKVKSLVNISCKQSLQLQPVSLVNIVGKRVMPTVLLNLFAGLKFQDGKNCTI